MRDAPEPAAAARALDLSYRQVKRLMVRFRSQGAFGLVQRRSTLASVRAI